MSNREGRNQWVWVETERCFGVIVGSLNAHYTTIQYIKGGMEFEVLMENDEFTLLEEELMEYDED